jgi:hypothetical protein
MTKIAREVDHPHEKERGLSPSQEREREAEARAERNIIADIDIARYPPQKMKRKLRDAENVDENAVAAARRKSLWINVMWMKSK